MGASTGVRWRVAAQACVRLIACARCRACSQRRCNTRTRLRAAAATTRATPSPQTTASLVRTRAPRSSRKERKRAPPHRAAGATRRGRESFASGCFESALCLLPAATSAPICSCGCCVHACPAMCDAGGPFAATHLLKMPLLHRYAAFLAAEGVTMPKPAESDAWTASPVAVPAGHAGTADAAATDAAFAAAARGRSAPVIAAQGVQQSAPISGALCLPDGGMEGEVAATAGVEAADDEVAELAEFHRLESELEQARLAPASLHIVPVRVEISRRWAEHGVETRSTENK
eukprot:6192585-Pleurochrysis_carterae.AAC.4